MRRIIPLFLAAVLLLAGCSSSNQADTKAVNENTLPTKKVYLMAGKIDTSEKADISSKIPARVSEVNVDIGSVVKKGDPVVMLDTKDIEAQVAQAEAAVATAQANLNKAQNGSRSEQVRQAQASYDNAKSTYDRTKKLFEQGAVSKQQMENVQLQYLSAQEQLNMLSKDSPDNIKVFESQLKQAQAALDVAKAQLSNGIIASPVSGTVSAKNISVGELAPAGVVLVSIVNDEALIVNAYLPAGLVGKVKVAQNVTVKVSEVAEKEYQGEVATIDPVVDSKGKNVLVKVKLKDSDSSLKPGMFAEIALN